MGGEISMEEKGFKVEDKRVINEKGELKEEVKKKLEEEKKKNQEETLPPVTFSSFILSLNASALIYLGEIPNPQTKKYEKNLNLAKQTIDLLGILKEKTKGNLTKEEDNLLENILFDLRMKFVKCQR